jgi:hypothetical protein
MQNILILISLIFTHVPMTVASRVISNNKVRTPTVIFCELLKHPERYNGKVIHTRAVFRRGGEEIAEFYCPKCADLGRVYFDVDESYESRTKPEIHKIIQKDGFSNVVLTGRFQVANVGEGYGHLGKWHYKFIISRIERADVIPMSADTPELLNKKILRRARCE